MYSILRYNIIIVIAAMITITYQKKNNEGNLINFNFNLTLNYCGSLIDLQR